MNSEAKKYTLNILGQTYTIVTDEQESIIINAANLIDSLMKEIAQKSTSLDTHKVAVLAALQYATKFLAHEKALESISKKERELLSVIEKEMQSSL